VIARPEVRAYADLEGKLLGVAAENGSITLSIRRLLAQNGVKREDFRARFVDGTPARLDCLTAGDCDAVPLGQPHDFVAMRRGYRLLGYSTDAVPEYLYTVTAARREWAAANKDTLVRYARALASAFQFIRDPANRARVTQTIVDTTGFASGNAQLTLGLYFEPERRVLPRAGEINMQGVEAVIALMAEGGTLMPPLPSAERFVDLQYLRAAGIQ
jgi:ABC-type nitrate/sulfonate/bicarbonate transport system substrate-binding protein